MGTFLSEAVLCSCLCKAPSPEWELLDFFQGSSTLYFQGHLALQGRQTTVMEDHFRQ